MKRKCDKCERPATNHSVEIVKGQKLEKHLCDYHAAQEGLSAKAVAQQHASLPQLLDTFVKAQTGQGVEPSDAACQTCGMTFREFREHSLLGCPDCYRSFEKALSPLLERAHDGATHHVGKVPRRAGANEQRQQQLSHLRKRLGEAVTEEDYELAARLRDEIHRYENAN